MAPHHLFWWLKGFGTEVGRSRLQQDSHSNGRRGQKLEGEVVVQLEQGNTEDTNWTKDSSELWPGNSTTLWSFKPSSLLMIYIYPCRNLYYEVLETVLIFTVHFFIGTNTVIWKALLYITRLCIHLVTQLISRLYSTVVIKECTNICTLIMSEMISIVALNKSTLRTCRTIQEC